MHRKDHRKRFTSFLLTIILLFQMAASSISALDFRGDLSSGSGGEIYADDDSVRVSIVLEDAPTIAVPYSIENIAANEEAMAYRHKLQQVQELVVDNIETYALDGEELDVVWNLTLIANVITANVEYGRIDDIKALDGVVDVFVEQRIYLDVMDTAETVAPAMAGSSAMTGSFLSHAAGFTGAGSRVAIIDTGIDTDHRSFDAAAFEHSLKQLEERGLVHMADLDLMTAATIEGVLAELNIADKGIDVNDLYYSSKLPFAYNYADPGQDVNHHEGQASKDMEHGSHVAGIAAANTYVPDHEHPGEYLYAADAVGVCGVAPDAQILTLRVFDKMGGAYESTYMVAIEDAILLGADSINLSLGSAVSGFNRSNLYADLLEYLINSGTVCVASAGNNGAWADYGRMDGYILSEDVNFNTLGSPGSFSATLSVGSVDNNNTLQPHFTVDGQWVFCHTVQTDAGPLSGVAGERTYVYLPDGAFDDENLPGDLAEAVRGNIAVCQRDGKTPLAKLAENAAKAGAIAVILVNHEEGTLDPVLAGYHGNVPVITVTRADGAFLKQSAQEVRNSDGTVYYRGQMTVGEDFADERSEYYTMSFFSAMGVPGNLSLAPDIVAPGGNILSVNGRPVGGQAYVGFSGTSMAGPQIAGMSAVLAQYVRDLKFTESNYSARFLIQNLLMSTAIPFKDTNSGNYYPVFHQGSGLADLDRALNAQALILMSQKATPQYNDGKVKAEFGDDSKKTGIYQYEFTIVNFSGKENAYRLSSELFTQAIKEDQILSNGEKVDFLDKLTTRLEADVTYSVDGSELKAGETFMVEACKSVKVSVRIRLTAEQKNILDASYPNGAYVEGYTFITGAPDDEGVRDVEYSIPLIGFYGDWGDASMYDRASYVDWLYGDKTLSYIYPYSSSGNSQYANYFSIVDPKTDESRRYTGNPYTLEDTFPVGRGAIRSTDTISGYSTILIRSAAAAAVYLTDSEGKWIGMGNVRYQVEAASNHRGSWMTTTVVIPFSRTPASMNLKEDDVFSVNVVAVPEYYETDGNISAEALRALIEDKKLVKGAVLQAATLTVDDTAPKILEVREDEEGILTVTAEDNHYIAYMCITDRSGTVVYGSCVPNGGEGEKVTCTFDLRDADLGPTCAIFVGDYAANSTTQYYKTKRTYPSLEGKLGGYIHAGKGDYNKAWTLIDPSDPQNAGITPIAYHGGDTVTAAAYVDGYIYQVIGSKLYTSPVDEIDYLTELVDLERFRLHSVSALSYNRADHLLYALAEENALWSIDPRNGRAEQVTKITVSNLAGAGGRIVSMAIDGEGNFYGSTYYDTGSSWFVKWTTEQLREDQLVLTGTRISAEVIRNRYGSMTYDMEKGVLYLAEAYSDNVSSAYNRLLCIDPEKNTVTYAADKLNYAVRGLFAVPLNDDGDEILKPTETIQELDILPDALKMFITGQEDLSPLITPWTAKDKALIWDTSDPDVVTVKDGVITAQGTGTAIITVTSASDPNVKDTCSITVEKIPSIQMSAMIYERDQKGYLASYDVASPKELTDKRPLGDHAFYAGGLSNGKLYVHDGYFMYTVDPETCDAEQVMMFTYLEFLWSDAAQAPKGYSPFYEVAGLHLNNGVRLGMYRRELRAPLSNELPMDSPGAAVAYVEDDAESAMGSIYYVLAENGALYRVAFSNPFRCEFLGVVSGVNLRGVSSATQGISASMWYDQTTGYLVLSSRLKGERAKVQLIDPDELRVMSTTEFSEDVWYATALYQPDTSAGSATESPAYSAAYTREELLSPESPWEFPEPAAENAVSKETHSVYEGLEELLAAPILRPYAAAGTAAARVGDMTYSTLQEAIDEAHARIQQGNHEAQTVTLLKNVTESVRDVWIRGHIDYDYNLTIDLNGYTVTGNGGPVLWLEAGGLGGAKYGYHVTIMDSSGGKGTITGGTGRLDAFSKTNGGGIYFSGSTVNDSLTIRGGVIQDNHVTGNGGAIAMSGDSAAHLIITGGVIRGNTATNGAVSGRWITMTGGEITENQVAGAGGGLYLWGAGTQELKVADDARIYSNAAGTMGDDIVVVSQRGGVTYRVDLSDPAEWDDAEASDAVVAWYADGADGLYDHASAGPNERFNAANPQILNDYIVEKTGRSASAYGIAAKKADDAAEENEYTVTYTDGAEGTVFPEEKHTGLKAGAATPQYGGGTMPTRQGYQFIGWDPAWSSVVTEDVTYVALWQEIKAEGVTLDHTELSLKEGEGAELNAAVSPDTALNQTVQWSVEQSGTVVTLVIEENRVTLRAVGVGTATVTAEINGFKESCTITVTHDWGEPKFDWQQTEDGYSVTVTRTCTLDHTQTAAVKATVKDTTLPTCTTNGSITYTATVSFDGEEFTQTKEVAVPATGHRYGKPVFDWSDDGKMADATFTCQHDPSHVEKRQALVTNKIKQPATCIADGVTTYTATVNFEGKQYTETKDVADIPMVGHRYSNYQYDNNATYWEDGTETAECDYHCGTKDTRPAKGTKLTDAEAPTATITIGENSWRTFLNNITFGLFFNETQDVTVKAEDAGSGVDKIYYYLSHTEIGREEIEKIDSWTEYKTAVPLDPDAGWIVYVKATDKVGNVGYYSSNGIVLDATAPVISGITDGDTYYAAVTVTVEEENLDTVTVNGSPVALDADNRFILTGKDGVYTVVATDKAGNRTEVTVTLLAKELIKIEVTKKPNKTQYLEGESLNTAGMEVTAYYNDGSSASVTGYTITGYTSTPGTKTVTVSYQGKTTSFAVNVTAKSVTSITMKSNPKKTEYLTGESLDLTGAKITVKYNNGTSEEIAVDSSMVTGYDPNKVGSQTVTVAYGGKTASFTVTVQPRVPTSITSDVYSVSGGYISKIGAGTTASQLLNGVNEKAYCKVYKGNTEVSGSALIGTGMEVRLMNGSAVVAKVTIVVTGDTNGDGEITITDMLAVKSHLLGKDTLTGAAAKAADTSGDKEISITDFIQIKAHILGKEKVQARAC